MVARYFLNGMISSTSSNPNLVGPSDSLYQYMFLEMEGVNGDTIDTQNYPTQNYYGFDDRFTYNFSQAAKDDRRNCVGQEGIFNESYNVKKGKSVVGQSILSLWY